ncbi:hypothetical protein DFS34DRAFT_621475 [Phlyctochytrium arcticum]|nr:hypothetical protein DFS34DRAFT_621475 [Phlyctochytrium arcticum]
MEEVDLLASVAVSLPDALAAELYLDWLSSALRHSIPVEIATVPQDARRSLAKQLDAHGVKLWNTAISENITKWLSCYIREAASQFMMASAELQTIPKAEACLSLAHILIRVAGCWLDRQHYYRANDTLEKSHKLLEECVNVGGDSDLKFANLQLMQSFFVAEADFALSGSVEQLQQIKNASHSMELLKSNSSLLSALIESSLRSAKYANREIDAIQWCDLGLESISLCVSPLSTKLEAARIQLLILRATCHLENKTPASALKDAELLCKVLPGRAFCYFLRMKALLPGSTPENEKRKAVMQVFQQAIEHCSIEKNNIKHFHCMIMIMTTSLGVSEGLAAIHTLSAHLEAVKGADRDLQSLRIWKLQLLLKQMIGIEQSELAHANSQLEEYLNNDEIPHRRVYLLILWQAAEHAFQVCKRKMPGRSTAALESSHMLQGGSYASSIQILQLSLTMIGSNTVDLKNKAIIERKIAVCFIRSFDLDRARDAALRALALEGSNESLFLALSTFILAGNPDEALSIINKISFSEDTERWTLAVARMAYEAGDRTTLAEIIKRFLAAFPSSNKIKSPAKLMVLLRCLLKLSTSDASITEQTLMDCEDYCDQVYQMLRLQHEEDGQVSRDESDWLYRTVWNLALRSSLMHHYDLSCRYFDKALECLSFKIPSTREACEERNICLLATAAAHLILARQATDGGNEHLIKAHDALWKLGGQKNGLKSVAESLKRSGILYQTFSMMLEVLLRLNRWDETQTYLKDIQDFDVPVSIYERFAGTCMRPFHSTVYQSCHSRSHRATGAATIR